MNEIIQKILILLQIWGSVSFSMMAKDASFYAANSVLSSGTWWKIRIPSDGVYKLTYEDLISMGFTNPAHVQIRGYGGWVLDEDFSTSYYDDLPQISVWMNKGADEIFNQGDYVLFYGRGPLKITRSGIDFVQTNNPYSNYGYYFVTEGQDEPKQMGNISSLTNFDIDVTTYSDYMIHEKDDVNLLESGREFYGEYFYLNNSQDISFDIPGIVSWDGYYFNFILKPSSPVNLVFGLNKKDLYTRVVGANTNTHSAATSINQYITGVSSVSETNIFNIALSSTAIKNSYLNFLRVYFKRNLQPYNTVTFFRNDLDSLTHRYLIANATENMIVLDVTDNISPSIQETSYANGQLSFSSSASSLRKYALVDLSKQIATPDITGKIANQDLHALAKYDMIIISPQAYKSYAQKLADLHYEKDSLSSIVVDPNEIYNEFSSGNPDATALRRFLKMFYDRGTSDSDRPKYLLLFGAGTYNNKFINSSLSDSSKSNYLLTYQSINSLSQTSSFVTDDYFGFLQEEGILNIAASKLCLGIGRLPARSQKEAEVFLDKISSYMEDTNYGIWKNNICFLADDAVGATGYSPTTEMYHEKQSDKYAEYVQIKYPNFVVNKIYEDSYRRIGQSNGYRYPDAQTSLKNKLNEGLLVLNYVGHGSSRSWTHEGLMTFTDLQSLRNRYLPLWITATCDFSRFDSDAASGGEAALANSQGGAIALLSTVRIVYIANNDSMSTNIYKNIFERDNGKALRFGDMIRKSKLSFTTNDENKVRFQLLGDPALRLAYPDDAYKVKVTSVNGADVSSSDTLTVSALSHVKISGQIVDGDSNLSNDFSGKVSCVVFDAQQDLKTRDNGGDGSIFYYKGYSNSIYSGTVNVENGAFDCEFIVPKDIAYTKKHGKMSFYAWEDAGRTAQGAFLAYKVNGTNAAASTDTSGPQINSLYLNSTDFVSGGSVNVTPTFHVGLSDESSINLSSGLGHTVNLIIDGQTQYDITSHFVSTSSSAKEGYIGYTLPELAEGSHSLKFTVWDVFNNYSEQYADFVVVDNNKTYASEFSFAKNPVVGSADFLFSTDAKSADISVRYDVYSASGELVWSHRQAGSYITMGNYAYSWDLKTISGESIRPGVYPCKATVYINGNQQSTKTLKLIVFAQ
ncbi:MAG: hypothetical protein H6Q14_679 [Bacteroidetes bacterium]|nr:hypothetical protein [Bacteroidota bacterium]